MGDLSNLLGKWRHGEGGICTRPEMIPKIDVNTTRNDPQSFSHATWNDPRGIIGVEWENISISGIRLKLFNSVFRLIRNAKFFGYKREIFSKWLIDCTKLFSVRMIAWNYFFHNNVEVVIPDRRNCSAKMLPVSSQSRRSLFRWTFYQKISWIQQCRWTRRLQLWFYSAFWRASSRVGSISAVSRVRSLILPNSGW